MAGINKEYLKEHKVFRRQNKNIIVIFPLIAILVAIIVFWCLKLVGITVTNDALCEIEEISTCYSDGEFVCTKPEHIHSSECFSKDSVDTETSYDWKKTFDKVTITNDIKQNLISIAGTQVGYTESLHNYEYNALAEKHSYTRYGEWYGSSYGEWNTMFVSFCLNYANINDSDSLISASAESMRCAWSEKNLYSSYEEYSGARGDVVFFDMDSDKKADRTGIVIYKSEGILIAIEGDVEGSVKEVVYKNYDNVLGYGKTSGLYEAKHIVNSSDEYSEQASVKTPELSGRLNKYIPNSEEQPVMFKKMKNTSLQSVSDDDPLIVMLDDDHGITYTSLLEQEIVSFSLKTLNGEELTNGATIYLGETYTVSIEFSEINTGSEWIQFRHDKDGYLTYQIPSKINCKPFEEWHPISAKTENGTIADVGEYYVEETGLLKVRFFEDKDGINFVEKYSNVDFSIDFNATVAASDWGDRTEIEFNDKLKLDLIIDGNASMDVTKTHGEYDPNDNTVEYTIQVKAIHGLVKNLIIDDQIWENHYALRDTIVVTDLEGNILEPQPIVSDHPSYSQGAEEGFRLSGFPDFSAGEGFLIKYKTQIYDHLTSNEAVDMWNGIDAFGKNALNGDVYKWADDWLKVEPEKMKKTGRQSVVTDNNRNPVPVIEWEVEIRKNNYDLEGTVVIDTLSEGLNYYKAQPILVKHYDKDGNKLPDTYISWDDVTINGNSMSLNLPKGYSFVIQYYTTYKEPDEGEVINYTNNAKVTINGREEQAAGSAEVVGFVPYVTKSASGDDGEYVYFTIEADVPATIKDLGGFYLTDLSAIWSYNADPGYLYIENIPEDMVITTTTESGKTITFTPYKEGGPVENTYILVAPAAGNQWHSFNVYFNTATADTTSSKWILSEKSKLKITYKIPFDAKTGTEWEGELTGNLTLEDVLLQGNTMSNEVYFNYTSVVSGTDSVNYEYSPILTKKSNVNENGIIDYTVIFNNTIPGSSGDKGYLNGNIDQMLFNDTFDDKLEYVPNSLVVTGYSPWQKDLWLCKYQYTGLVTGNTIKANAENFRLVDYNEASGWNTLSNALTLRDYYRQVNAGGKFIFTYKLKVKDIYLYTTDVSKFMLDNTAEVTWDNDGSSGPVTNTSEFYTGLIHKHVHQDGAKLDFQVHINRKSLDIIEGVNELVIRDVMSSNLSVYWESIKLKYEKSTDVWIDFDAPESKYSYTLTYDQPTNTMTFVVPDSLHIIIDYTTLITEDGDVSVANSVEVGGKSQVTDVIDASFFVKEHSGGASGSNHKITLLKQDGLTNIPLPDATFLLYGPMGDPAAIPPSGVSKNIVAEDGTNLKFIGTYSTGKDGTAVIETQYLTEGGPYALVEYVAPQGYELLEKPVYFYFYTQDPKGEIQSVTTLIAIENFSGVFVMPETGGKGIFTTATIGFVLVAFPIFYSLIRRKKERRLII
ncbi:MAG: SpaA isopeptide-forming pilin-related protein [Ruminococcus sp.]|nr:SpaA isopeptide-forming pilin-related protein [Ruminococcus sp.]